MNTTWPALQWARWTKPGSWTKAVCSQAMCWSALPSSGVHSNGFSLVRKVFDVENKKNFYSEELGTTLWESLLTPTRIYVKQVLALMEQVKVKSVCHITGAAFMRTSPAPCPMG